MKTGDQQTEESKIVREYHYLGVRVDMVFTGDRMDILEQTATKFENLLNPNGYVVDGDRYNSLLKLDALSIYEYMTVPMSVHAIQASEVIDYLKTNPAIVPEWVQTAHLNKAIELGGKMIDSEPDVVLIKTPHGYMETSNPTDYIVRQDDGGLYCLQEDIFLKTHKK